MLDVSRDRRDHQDRAAARGRQRVGAAGVLLDHAGHRAGLQVDIRNRHLLRRRVPDLELVEEVTALVVGAVLLGVLVEVLAALSGGALGNGRLVDLGPPAFVTGLAAGGLVGAGAVLYSLVKRLMPTVWVTDSDPATRGAGVRGRGSARRGEAEGRLLGP